MRLDKFLYNEGIIYSRNKIKDLIINGFVKINGKKVLKPSFELKISNNLNKLEEKKIIKENNIIKINIENYIIEIDLSSNHVSRGYYKLQYAIEKFNFEIKDKIFIDIGASTGGFTEVLLDKGAKFVIAIDSGENQLHEKLRNNPKVFSIEKINAKYLKKEILPFIPDCFVADVSFISITKILLNLFDIVRNKKGIILFKPQYEQELIFRSSFDEENFFKLDSLKNKIKINDNLKKFDFIIKNEEKRKKILDAFIEWCKNNNILINGILESPIKGVEGNIEYLIYIEKGN